MPHPIRHQTVVLIGKLLHPLTESNLIPFPEYREIIAQLKHLADKGTPLPTVIPKLVDQTEAATMLGPTLNGLSGKAISHSSGRWSAPASDIATLI